MPLIVEPSLRVNTNSTALFGRILCGLPISVGIDCTSPGSITTQVSLSLTVRGSFYVEITGYTLTYRASIIQIRDNRSQGNTTI